MADWVLWVIGDLLVDIVFYQLGRWTLWLFTGGRYDTIRRGTNEGLVELLGFLIFLALIFAAVICVSAGA